MVLECADQVEVIALQVLVVAGLCPPVLVVVMKIELLVVPLVLAAQWLVVLHVEHDFGLHELYADHDDSVLLVVASGSSHQLIAKDDLLEVARPSSETATFVELVQQP